MFERLTRMESSASITTGYLMTAVHHGCMNVIRKKNRHEQVRDFYPVELEDETYLAVQRLERLAEIQHCINNMGEPCHSIFRMRFDDDLTIREIAEHTKLSVGTVHKYLQQGIQQIKLHFNQKMKFMLRTSQSMLIRRGSGLQRSIRWKSSGIGRYISVGLQVRESMPPLASQC